MRYRSSILVLAASAVLASCVSPQSAMQIATLPNHVQAFILNEVGTGKISKVEKEIHNKLPAVEVKWTKDGREMEAVFNLATGLVVVREEVVALNTTPAAVQAAVVKELGTDQVKVERMEEGGIVTYEANGAGREVLFSAAGKVVK
jgi:hypothetical protein